MGFKYLNDQNWQDITREERFFCLELYNEIKKDEKKFVKWLYENTDWQNETTLKPFDKKTLLGDSLIWEVGYEVCFYRDYIKAFGYEGNKHIRTTHFPMKRTFDLCLFSEKHIIIIEAKYHEGFTTKQMNEFKDDIEHLKNLLADKCPENIGLIGLYKSNSYSPKKETLRNFHGVVSWKDTSNIVFTLP